MKLTVKNQTINLPDEFTEAVEKGKGIPGMNDEAVQASAENGQAAAYIAVNVIEPDDTGVRSTKAELIEIMNGRLNGDSGLISVEDGITDGLNLYNYSVTKRYDRDTGRNVYFFGGVIQSKEYQFGITGLFTENAEIGKRAEYARNIALEKGWITEDGEGWEFYPYSRIKRNCFPMDFSDFEYFDRHFPDHALSWLRRTAEYLIKNN